MEELKIIVAGKPGTGKSSISLLLYEFFKKRNFNVELKKENPNDDRKIIFTKQQIDDNPDKYIEQLDIRMFRAIDSIKERNKISIETKQTVRNGRNN